MKMQIIGHRGAAGLALENSLESIKLGVNLGVDAVECDVWLTKDRQVVLCHDPHLAGVSDNTHFIQDLTYAELTGIALYNGQHVPLLREVLKVIGQTRIIIETKKEGTAEEVLPLIADFPDTQITITSIKPSEIEVTKKARPSVKAYLIAVLNPFEVVHIAKAAGADGLNLNFWILNPLTYWMARNEGFDIMVYTVNWRFVANFIHLLYPRVLICTDYPNKFITKRRPKINPKSRHES